MQTNDYDGLIPDWQLSLIRARIRALRVRHDVDDLEQDLVRIVAAFSYDAAHANGASHRTALTRVIDNRILNAKRRRTRYDRRLDDLRRLHAEAETDTTMRDVLAQEVRDVVAALPADERVVCAGLAAGESINRIAHELQCTWHTVRRIIDRLRDHFIAIGLEPELDG